MVVTHIINVRWYNATAWYATTLADISNRNGEEHIILSIPEAPVLDVATKLGIKNFAFNFNTNNPIKIIKTIIDFEYFLKSHKVDIIIAHRGEFFWYFALRKYLGKTPQYLIRIRGDNRRPTSDILSRWFHNTITDAIIVTASKIRRYFLDNLKTPTNKLHLIVGGVNHDIFFNDQIKRETIRTEFGYSDTDYVIAVIGRFDPVKGHKIFFQAMGEIYKNNSKLKLLLVGFPENISCVEIMLMAKDNGVESITTITGRRDDIPSIINAIDLGVVSSIDSETIARVAFEIMATEKDIIAADIGVLPDIINKENIYIHTDSSDLVDKINNHMRTDKIYTDTEFYREYAEVVKSILKK